MNAVEIEEAISALADRPFDAGEFPCWRARRISRQRSPISMIPRTCPPT
jgi:hypothetical protein